MQRVFAAALAITCLVAVPVNGQTLRGSAMSVDRQHSIAVEHDYSFLNSVSDVNRFVGLGLLVPVKGGTNYELGSVSFPYARPAVRTFVERLSGQYRSACGERLVVTSLTRPENKQPRNASDYSVHPAGMAVDLRISNKSSCRRWLESTLLSLEKSGVLEATRERRPAHYHIAVFPTQYLSYVDRLENRSSVKVASAEAAPARPATTVVEQPATRAVEAAADDAVAETDAADVEPDAPATTAYRVHRGDTLWSIARRSGTTVNDLKQMNGLRSARIAAGQVITIPANRQ